MKTVSLTFIWGIRLRLWTESARLRTESVLEAYGNVTI